MDGLIVTDIGPETKRQPLGLERAYVLLGQGTVFVLVENCDFHRMDPIPGHTKEIVFGPLDGGEPDLVREGKLPRAREDVTNAGYPALVKDHEANGPGTVWQGLGNGVCPEGFEGPNVPKVIGHSRRGANPAPCREGRTKAADATVRRAQLVDVAAECGQVTNSLSVGDDDTRVATPRSGDSYGFVNGSDGIRG